MILPGGLFLPKKKKSQILLSVRIWKWGRVSIMSKKRKVRTPSGEDFNSFQPIRQLVGLKGNHYPVFLAPFPMKTLRSCLLFLPLFFLASLQSCTTKSVDAEISELCPDAGKFVKKVESVIGRIQFNSTRQQYAIQRAIPGTYDSVDVGYLCNLPEEFQKPGLKIEFSGSYFENDEVPASFAGLENYYLTLTKIARAP